MGGCAPLTGRLQTQMTNATRVHWTRTRTIGWTLASSSGCSDWPGRELVPEESERLGPPRSGESPLWPAFRCLSLFLSVGGHSLQRRQRSALQSVDQIDMRLAPTSNNSGLCLLLLLLLLHLFHLIHSDTPLTERGKVARYRSLATSARETKARAEGERQQAQQRRSSAAWPRSLGRIGRCVNICWLWWSAFGQQQQASFFQSRPI